MSSGREHAEVVVLLRPGADPAAVMEALARGGLQVTRLTAGVLAAGDAAAIVAAFGAESLERLNVPGSLQAYVESVALVPPKSLHGGDD
jgi:hypothetical protein